MNQTKVLFEFDQQGNLVYRASVLELPKNTELVASEDIPVHKVSEASTEPKVNLPKYNYHIQNTVNDTILTLKSKVSTLALPSISVKSPSLQGVNNAVASYFQHSSALRILGNGLIIAGILGLFVSFYPIVASQLTFFAKEAASTDARPAVVNEAGFGQLISEKPKISLPALKDAPVNSEFSIIIEKIGVNAPIVENVNSADYNAYMDALKRGAAHAAGTAVPGQKVNGNGNTFIFAHSTLNLWEVPKYNAIFILLNKLEEGDRITAVYKGERFDYIVTSKKVVEADDVKYLTEPSDDKILTLQTCDPPGTNLRRLIIQAKLVNEEGQPLQ